MAKKRSRFSFLGKKEPPNFEKEEQVEVNDHAQGIPVYERREIRAPIGRVEIDSALQKLRDYQKGKAALDRRIVENEQWYRLRHWEEIGRSKNKGDPEPTSAWLFNNIANKHADAMDNFPEPSVLAREQSDEAYAKLLSEVLPVVLKYNKFERTYSEVWWYKLKTGTGVYGVFWDSKKDNGLGDIDIRKIDILNLFWEPGCMDVQKSQNLFHVELIDRDSAAAMWPELKDDLASPTILAARYKHDDSIDVLNKVEIVDWYYKRLNNEGRLLVHFCKFSNGHVLYASENDPRYAQTGFYDHGKYPFVFDVLFPVEDCPAGFGHVDICKSPQLFIDKLDQVILKHGVMGARPRFWVRGDGKINEEEYADWTKDFVHFNGSGDPKDSIFPIEIPSLSETYVSLRELKVNELKETSGNRDFSQGGTSSGVTAASAIAALQEAGSKLSRDMIATSYDAFEEINHLCIELMRQFYNETRYFRIVGERGEIEYKAFSGRMISPAQQGADFGQNMGIRIPIFDIDVHAQRSSPFSTIAQNERAKELYGMGFFRPDLSDQALAALDMMTFEGIEKVRDRISQNGTMYQQIQTLTQQVNMLASIIGAQSGTNMLAGINGAQNAETQASGSVDDAGNEIQSDKLGAALNSVQNSSAGAARVKAARAATPKS